MPFQSGESPKAPTTTLIGRSGGLCLVLLLLSGTAAVLSGFALWHIGRMEERLNHACSEMR